MIKNRGGFVQMIVAIIISIAILSLFGVDIEERVKSPLIQKNLSYAWSITKAGFIWVWDKASSLMK
ncbi:MAG: hypothetical protein A3D52_01445 [Candidatus Taylorbacteria bacterium RIFCSPHIGHO2_02_FULL_44_36]|uniref:Uncharacterized protein n=1 Tax=Candidatus Taylorbacteria bacterium RIFCSPLOWO2_12_FULL_44_15c TaxID=1802333 RepID=A0A1G2P5U3_9BACT|nr:MAG: hypothetical protein A2W42_06345 [Candidatus Muproteobacteria bacterium RIFCSPHIGHO2_01_60_12]OHA26033.1 MAG: hypothetical protein A3D52_01445 [Candidatus Taylorbacteria bacterium RIFCSPHIGHO2_02_FULL_44_36]OHA43726.1 MAG: hypothetical protein A3G03_02645 [Candidatus Taylorbacteria bacterium RIFCSPLOWO2_12_FULL_44_15c]